MLIPQTTNPIEATNNKQDIVSGYLMLVLVIVVFFFFVSLRDLISLEGLILLLPTFWIAAGGDFENRPVVMLKMKCDYKLSKSFLGRVRPQTKADSELQLKLQRQAPTCGYTMLCAIIHCSMFHILLLVPLVV
jgi:hypothetical protein